MTIRAKVGDQVEFGRWIVINGQPSPPTPWTGVIVQKKPADRWEPTTYHIKRDHDGQVITAQPKELKRYAKAEGQAGP